MARFGSLLARLGARFDFSLARVVVALLGALASVEPVHAQDAAGGGEPTQGDTNASTTASGSTGEDFATDTTTPYGGVSQPPPAPARQYGRSDPFLPVRLDGHVALTWEGSFGVGLRVDIPLVSGTFRYSGRDELALSVGSDVTFIAFNGSQRVEVFPTAVLQWSLGLDERTFLYPELGLVGHIDDGEWSGLHPNIGFGARHYLHRSLSLQGRFGWPIAISGGVTF